MKREFTELWEAVLLKVLHAMPEKELQKLWQQTEQSGAVLVLEVGRRQAAGGFDVSSRVRVDTPVKFGSGDEIAPAKRSARRKS
jgi:hypothetical protein